MINVMQMLSIISASRDFLRDSVRRILNAYVVAIEMEDQVRRLEFSIPAIRLRLSPEDRKRTEDLIDRALLATSSALDPSQAEAVVVELNAWIDKLLAKKKGPGSPPLPRG